MILWVYMKRTEKIALVLEETQNAYVELEKQYEQLVRNFNMLARHGVEGLIEKHLELLEKAKKK
jgi:hypothetical protein